MTGNDEPESPATGTGSGSRVAGWRWRLIGRLEEKGRYQKWVLATALVGMFATTFPVTILVVSLGDIAVEFDTSETVLTWVLSAPLLTSAVALPILGKMGDLYGHRRVFMAGFTIATIVAALTALSWGPGSLIGFRTIAQTVGAATQPASLALIMTVFSPQDRVKAMGYWSLVAAGAPSIGLIAGGPIVEAVGWRMLFVLQAGFAFIALVVAAIILTETGRRENVRFDVPGSIALAFATGGLMLLFSQGAEWGWEHPLVIVSAVVAPVALVVFVFIERRTTDPLLPLELLRERNFTGPIVNGLFTGAAYMGGFILAPLLLRFVLGYGLSAVAFIMVLRPLSFSLSSPVGGHIATRLGERGTGMLGAASIVFSMVALASGAMVQSIELIGAGLVLQGLGNGFSRPPMSATIANAAGEENFGIAAASNRMMFQLGAAFGIAVLSTIYGGVNEPEAFMRAFVFGMFMGIIAFIAASFVRSVDRRPAAGVERRRERVEKVWFLDTTDPAVGGGAETSAETYERERADRPSPGSPDER